MKTRICILFIIVLITTACSSVVNMTSEKMNKLELGMSKQQVTEILGSNYTIAEKKIENAFRAKENGVQKVALIKEEKLSDQINRGNEGTEICL